MNEAKTNLMLIDRPGDFDNNIRALDAAEVVQTVSVLGANQSFKKE